MMSGKSECVKQADGTLSLGIRTLYDSHNHWLISWLYHRVGCNHDAADLAQDTFLRLMTGVDLSTIQEPRAWLLTAAKRLLIDRGRRRRLEQAYLVELESSVHLFVESPSMEQLWIAVETLEQISRALEKLSENARQAFLMRHLGGCSTPVIAEKLGVSDVMIRKYLVQGLVACHGVLDETRT